MQHTDRSSTSPLSQHPGLAMLDDTETIKVINELSKPVKKDLSEYRVVLQSCQIMLLTLTM